MENQTDSELIRSFRERFSFTNQQLADALNITEGSARKMCSKNATLSKKIKKKITEYLLTHEVNEVATIPSSININTKQGRKKEDMSNVSSSTAYRRKKEFIQKVAESIVDSDMVRPSDMNDIEIEVYDKMCSLIQTNVIPLASSDSFSLQILVETYYDYTEARKDCNDYGNTEYNLKAGTKVSPYFTIMTKLRDDFIKFCKDFGLTPKARIAMALNKATSSSNESDEGEIDL